MPSNALLQRLVEARRTHPVLLAELARGPFLAAVATEIAFFITAGIGSAGVQSISYPAGLRMVEVIAILAIIGGIAMLFVRSRYVPLIALCGTLLAIPVAQHDRTVPGQRGSMEIVALLVFALLWLAIAVAAFTVRPDA